MKEVVNNISTYEKAWFGTTFLMLQEKKIKKISLLFVNKKKISRGHGESIYTIC